MSSFTYSITVQSSFASLWELVCDVRRVAGLFPFTTVDEVHSPEPSRWLFRRRVTIPNMANLCWQELSWAEREGELRFQAVDGDLQTFTGLWSVTSDATGVKLGLNLKYEYPRSAAPARAWRDGGVRHG